MRFVLLILFLTYRINYSLKVETTNGSYLNLDNAPSFSSFVDDILAKKFELGSEKDMSNEYYLKFNLAPSFGARSNLAEENYLMDDDLKEIIANTTTAIGNIPETQRDWETVISELSQNTQIYQVEKSLVFRYDTLNKKGSNMFEESETPDKKIINEVLSWISDFVDDSDIVSSTNTDISETIETVGITSVRENDFGQIFYNKKHGQRDVFVVGILRYPDLETPYFKVYSLKLEAWCSVLRHFFVTWYKNGISAEIRVTRYEVQPLVLNNIQEQIFEEMEWINKEKKIKHEKYVRQLWIVLGSVLSVLFCCVCFFCCLWSISRKNEILYEIKVWSSQIAIKKTSEPAVGVPITSPLLP